MPGDVPEVAGVLLEDYFDFIGPDEIRLRGHRVFVEDVLRYYQEGLSAEQIAQELPSLSLEEIHATLAYYWRNQADVDAYLARVAARAEDAYRRSEAETSPIVRRLQALRVERSGASRSNS